MWLSMASVLWEYLTSMPLCVLSFNNTHFVLNQGIRSKLNWEKQAGKKRVLFCFFSPPPHCLPRFFILLLLIRSVFLEAVSVLKLISHISARFGLWHTYIRVSKQSLWLGHQSVWFLCACGYSQEHTSQTWKCCCLVMERLTPVRHGVCGD